MKATTSHVAVLALFLAVGGVALAPSAVQAQEESGEYDWKVFVGGSYVTPLSDSDIGGETIEAASEFGYEFGIEWKPSDRFGFELSYLDANHDVEVDGIKAAEIDFKPWNFTMNFHIIDRNAFNWYVGPTITYVDWGDIEFTGGSEGVDSETAYGVSTGLAIGLGQSMAIQFGLRYLDASAESSVDSTEVDIDPLFASVGIAFRF